MTPKDRDEVRAVLDRIHFKTLGSRLRLYAGRSMAFGEMYMDGDIEVLGNLIL
jgi:hypothetical protein